ncbi:MAG: hypothetical protein HN348_35415 [Proteobacteria bacterium]|jgi:hypothetical protein|nr:hypothetical protein [Pseudomonadota bacterium]
MPLIRILLDDPVLCAAYLEYMADFAEGPFSTAELTSRLEDAHELIEPFCGG